MNTEQTETILLVIEIICRCLGGYDLKGLDIKCPYCGVEYIIQGVNVNEIQCMDCGKKYFQVENIHNFRVASKFERGKK